MGESSEDACELNDSTYFCESTFVPMEPDDEALATVNQLTEKLVQSGLGREGRECWIIGDKDLIEAHR